MAHLQLEPDVVDAFLRLVDKGELRAPDDDGGGSTETFTVRRISYGVGIEKVFPVHSPYIERIEVERSSRVRRAKLYFLRDRTGKAARLREA